MTQWLTACLLLSGRCLRRRLVSRVVCVGGPGMEMNPQWMLGAPVPADVKLTLVKVPRTR